MLLSGSPRVKIRKSADKTDKGGNKMLSGSGSVSWSVGQELDQLARERTIQTDPGETRRRRTIRLVRQAAHHCRWGFTLQTYGIRHRATGDVEVMTYVDYVEMSSAAWIAGMRKGDVLLSVNGESVEGLNHDTLVSKIQHSPEVLRLVVLFEDCCRKVDLYERFIKLKRVLAKKKRELSQIEHQEKVLRSRGLLSPVGFSRDSVRSSTSTCSDWDRYSELGCAAGMDSPALTRPDWHTHPPDHTPTNPSPLTSPASQDPPLAVSENAPAKNGPTLPSGPPMEDSSSDSNSGVNLRVIENQVEEKIDDIPQVEEPQYSDTNRRRSHQEKVETEKVEEEEEEGKDFSESSSSSSSTGSEDEGSSSESDAVPPPVCRMRSNSTILNDMRMKLLASAAARLLEGGEGVEEEEEEEEEEEHTESDSQPEEISDSEVIVEIKEDGRRVWEGRKEEEEGEGGGEEEDVEGKKEEEEAEIGQEEREAGVNDESGEGEEAGVSFRLCGGVRVNDSDIVTKM